MTGLRVVLAEDHTLVRAGIRSLLGELSWVEVVGEAADGRDAVRLVSELAPQVVLMDITMSGLNGLDVLRAVRGRWDATELPVIMATAKDASQDVVEALELGANDYVTKPLDFPVVMARHWRR